MVSECQCYGHSEICFYDQTVADKRASLNMNEEYEGGGVCIKCRVSDKYLFFCVYLICALRNSLIANIYINF